ncbi:cytochrome P450 [Mollisia scopiformis]|uniref:Cytochrome P450 n=1 Tax=Mollisia scopiformis TaxID=149040 RepID=A0A194X5C7_MOLSC|nr:cytochrome P450 [Mollisia scopiformis]KUJ15017.1 cytochrome P450 [Mollisia scopiformis]
MLPLLPVLLGFLFFGFLWWAFSPRGNKKNREPLPPSPPADPIIGHVRVVPAERPELTYVKWGKEHNTDILYLNFFGKSTIVLNSVQAAMELLDRRGAKYSDRPDFPFMKEQGWQRNLAFFSSGPSFRRHRKMFQNAFTTANCVPYREAQEMEARKVVGRILKTPQDWQSHLIMFGTTVILRIAYGITVGENDDPYVELAKKASFIISNAGQTGATMVDNFPFLRYLPKWLSILPSLKLAREYYPYVRALHDLPFAAVKTAMSHGVAETSFVKKMLEEMAENDENEKKDTEAQINTLTDADVNGAAGTIYVAGQDTSLATLSMFVLNMTEHPEVQRKGWEEIESVIGKERLPTFADRDKLPYVDCIMQEVFRRYPVVPLGVPHKSAEDGTYKGYFIPKGRSTMVANAYAMLRDENVYKDPGTFNPSRYLPIEKGGAGEPLPIGQFGFGRRICPGRHLATASVWMVMATMLATLEISRPKDINGNDIIPAPTFSTGIVSHPAPFLSVLKPRFENVAELLS